MAHDAAKFVHLHLHSEYSLLDGGNRIGPLIERVKELGMDAVALTDHGNLFGAVAFYAAARAAGIKPILGIEAYVAPGERTDRTYSGIVDGGHHLVLLAENATGWDNLLQLSSDAYLQGFYYKPRMDKTTLAQWSEGLIAINGHFGSSLAFHLTRYRQSRDEAHWRAAVEEAMWHAETFGVNGRGEPCFFIELQRIEDHAAEQEPLNELLIKLARELDLPLVCDNDAHYLSADDWDAHDSLVCISTGKIKDDTQRLTYSKHLYVKSPRQMHELFADYHNGAGDEALANVNRIAERCHVDLDFETNHAPVVKVLYNGESHKLPTTAAEARQLIDTFVCDHPLGSTEWYKAFCAQFELHPYDSHRDRESAQDLKELCDGALRVLSEAGAMWRYGHDGFDADKRARLERELQVLADKLISAYFVIVWDFVNFARAQGIPSNARGSGVGTMVGYCLGLSNACPVRYGLLFERFTDPDRSEYPDIDIDICQDGRAAVIDYVRRKYGHVAQIITFGTLKARAVVRDVGRVMNLSVAEVDRIAKLVPGDLGMTLDKALDESPPLKAEYNANEQTHTIIDVGRRLEGMARHASVHAAGVVVATQPLQHIIPLYRDPKSGEMLTQWDGPTVEKVGLLKMDFLGLRTLSIIQRARELVRATLDEQTIRDTLHGGSSTAGSASVGPVNDQDDPLDLERVSYDDQTVLDLFRRGETAGVFQFESAGMRSLLVGMKPDRLEDLIAANALYRPGPMALIPDYNDRKHDRADVPNVHPIVDQFTRDTYGVMVYQEQVMQIIHELGDIPLREAYTIIKAISKKNKAKIAAASEKFIAGAGRQGLSAAQAKGLFELIQKFAGYGFNKSHSTGYAIVAYQTAYLKTYFPVQYMAALLTYESVNSDKVTEYIEACRRVRFPDGHTGIDVLPPDINESYRDFTVVYPDGEPIDANHGHIRFGLGAVKGVGERAIEMIIAARKQDGPFRSLHDFCERVPQGLVNKSVIEALIRCGAFDRLHGHERRAAMMAAAESAMSRGAQEAKLRTSDDFLFGDVAANGTEAAERGEGGAPEREPPLPDVPPWDTATMLAEEKAALGFYVSAHPLDRWRKVIDRFTNVSVKDAGRLRSDTPVTLGGMFTRVRNMTVKKGRSAGQAMAALTLEDASGAIEGVVFSDTYAKYAHLVAPERIVFLLGRIDRRRDEPNILVERIVPVEEAIEQLTARVKIVLREQGDNGTPRKLNGELAALKTMLRQSAGHVPVLFEVHANDKVVWLEAESLQVKPTLQMPQQIAGILQQPHGCELLGPVKLVRQQPAALLAEGEHEHIERLVRDTAPEDCCDSIDRY